MLGQQMLILSNILIIEIRYAEVEKNIQQERKIEQCEVFTVCSIAHFILNVRFNYQDPERLDKQIQEKQDNKIGDE
jgi:hypothetical protein